MFDILQNGGDLLIFNPFTVAFNIVLSFVLTLLISYIYKKTHSGLSYSKSFVFTLILMSILISVVMMVVGNNLAKAFTLLGAFTIIRFRTAIKDTRDIAFIFWALVTGMAVGTGNYLLSVVTTILIILIVALLNKINFASIKHYDHLLSFILNIENGGTDAYKPVFEKYLKSSNLTNVITRDGGQKLDFAFSIRLKNLSEEIDFINELRRINGIMEINLISTTKDTEY